MRSVGMPRRTWQNWDTLIGLVLRRKRFGSPRNVHNIMANLRRPSHKMSAGALTLQVPSTSDPETESYLSYLSPETPCKHPHLYLTPPLHLPLDSHMLRLPTQSLVAPVPGSAAAPRHSHRDHGHLLQRPGLQRQQITDLWLLWLPPSRVLSHLQLHSRW